MSLDKFDRDELPEADELWRDGSGNQNLVTGLSQHAKTNEALVVCRGCAPPHASIAYPLGAFLPTEQSEADEVAFCRLGAW